MHPTKIGPLGTEKPVATSSSYLNTTSNLMTDKDLWDMLCKVGIGKNVSDFDLQWRNNIPVVFILSQSAVRELLTMLQAKQRHFTGEEAYNILRAAFRAGWPEDFPKEWRECTGYDWRKKYEKLVAPKLEELLGPFYAQKDPDAD